jgi:hypothetical protein
MTTSLPLLPSVENPPVDPNRLAAIQFYDQRCRKSFADQMGYAFLAGVELNALKTEIAHGQFAAFRKQFLPELPERSAQRYMAFASALTDAFPAVGKSATVADLAKTRLLLTDGAPIPEGDLQAVCKAVHQAADGKTLTQFYRDLGVIREPKPKVHTPQKLTPDQQVAAEKEQALALADSIFATMTLAMMDGALPFTVHLTNAQYLEYRHKLIDFTKWFKAHGPKKSKAAAAKAKKGARK